MPRSVEQSRTAIHSRTDPREELLTALARRNQTPMTIRQDQTRLVRFDDFNGRRAKPLQHPSTVAVGIPLPIGMYSTRGVQLYAEYAPWINVHQD